MKKPNIQVTNWLLLGVFALFTKDLAIASIPPTLVSKAIRPPIAKHCNIIPAFHGLASELRIALHSFVYDKIIAGNREWSDIFKIKVPESNPIKSEIITFLVIKERRIAMKGGKIESTP